MLADLIPKLAQLTREKDQGYRRRPSSSGPERCERSMVYHGLGVDPEPFPGRTLLIFDDGNWHEELTLDWLRQSAYKIHHEQMTVETPCGTGHIDALISDPE